MLQHAQEDKVVEGFVLLKDVEQRARKFSLDERKEYNLGWLSDEYESHALARASGLAKVAVWKPPGARCCYLP